MDKALQRALKRAVRQTERLAVLRAMPLTLDQARLLFDFVNAGLAQSGGCDFELTFTSQWCRQNGLAIEHIVRWTEAHGGFCDCEVVCNVPGPVDDAVHGLFPTTDLQDRLSWL